MKTGPTATASLSSMLGHPILDTDNKPLGKLEDAVVVLREGQYPLVTGLVLKEAGQRVRVTALEFPDGEPTRIRARSESASWPAFERKEGDVLLKQDVLGHRLIDLERRALVRAYDVRLAATSHGWIATGLDVHKHRLFSFGAHDTHPARDWHSFLLLIGINESVQSKKTPARIKRLKPAQIADIIEGASAQEQTFLLAHVHADPELEAHVFEELEEDRLAALLKNRSDQEIADLLSRMRADDVADTVMDLPQERRRTVLDLLAPQQHTKVLTLLGYHEATAGGLMATDYLALSETLTIADALDKLRAATAQQPEALTTIHSLNPDGALVGTLGLVRALQLDPKTLLRDASDPEIVFASPEEDIIAVTTRMADYNLLTLPVLDAEGRVLGVVTVDDALEAAIPRDWTRRTPGNLTPRKLRFRSSPRAATDE